MVEVHSADTGGKARGCLKKSVQRGVSMRVLVKGGRYLLNDLRATLWQTSGLRWAESEACRHERSGDHSGRVLVV